MNAPEREEMIVLLEQGRNAFSAAIAGVIEERATRVPGPGRWSILGCAEHIATSEDYLFSQIARASPLPAPVVNREREARMLAHGDDRSRRIESPPEGHPSGIYPTLAAAAGHFLLSRERTIEFVNCNHEDLRAKATWHPILKQANCHEMLLSMCVHVLRHAKQIEEIKAELAQLA